MVAQIVVVVAVVVVAAGNVAGQLVGIELGVQDEFSYDAVAKSAISGAASAGVGAAASSAVSGKGFDNPYSGSGVPSNAIDIANNASNIDGLGFDVGVFGDHLASELLSEAITGRVSAHLYGKRFSFKDAAIQAVGNAIGNTLIETGRDGFDGKDSEGEVYGGFFNEFSSGLVKGGGHLGNSLRDGAVNVSRFVGKHVGNIAEFFDGLGDVAGARSQEIQLPELDLSGVIDRQTGNAVDRDFQDKQNRSNDEVKELYQLPDEPQRNVNKLATTGINTENLIAKQVQNATNELSESEQNLLFDSLNTSLSQREGFISPAISAMFDKSYKMDTELAGALEGINNQLFIGSIANSNRVTEGGAWNTIQEKLDSAEAVFNSLINLDQAGWMNLGGQVIDSLADSSIGFGKWFGSSMLDNVLPDGVFMEAQTYHRSVGQQAFNSFIDNKVTKYSNRMASDGIGGVAVEAGLDVGAIALEIFSIGKIGKLFTNKTSSLRSDACFVEGTLVHVEGGLLPIEKFVKGIRVLARDENTGEFSYKPVINTKVTPKQETYLLTIESSDGKIEIVRATKEHPFWIKDLGWKKAGALESGDELVDKSDSIAYVKSCVLESGVSTVYNIEVQGFHTYHICESGIWVHNDDCINILSSILDKLSPANQIARIANETSEVLQQQYKLIRDIDPNAIIGVRGSLARGTKGESKGFKPFDKNDFDVDAFIISDDLADFFPSTKNLRGLKDNSMLMDEFGFNKIQSDIDEGLRAKFGGLRDEEFEFRIVRHSETYAHIFADKDPQFYILDPDVYN